MLFYDLTINAWVRKPGSTSPPWMTPVLTIGGIFEVIVQFCNGAEIVTLNQLTATGGIKAKGDFDGSFLASDASPTLLQNGALSFVADLSTEAAAAYFTANPTVETMLAAFQIAYTKTAGEYRTQPLSIVLQNSYIPATVTP